MSLRSSTWATATHASEEDCGHQEVSTTALDFFLALARLGKEEIWRVGMSPGSGRKVGQGAFAFAVICEMGSKELVAVKRSLKLHGSLWVYQEQEFARHFKEFCLELRILLHDSLRSHENIINLRGIYEEDVSGVPSLSLVLEYADNGTLDYFLSKPPIKKEQLVLDCIFQLASGYEALHSLGICHGDVKTKNVLVVSNESRLVYKICDFGHAVVSSKIGDGSVQLSRGTEIYNAPEVRDLDGSAPSSFTIADALLTDVYSFGFLVWEVLMQGEVYYKTIQTPDLATPTSANIHDFLKNLPQNKLLEYALSAMDTEHFPKSFKDLFGFVVQGTLQYHPKDRMKMEAIKSGLSRNDDRLQPQSFVHNSRGQIPTPSTTQVKQDVEHQEDTSGDTILSWTGLLSLFELFNIYECYSTVHKISSSSIRETIQEQMLSELKKMAENSTLPQNTRASAALSVSQCLTMGYDSVYNTDDVLFWLRHAMTLGSPFASQWFSRFSDALCPDASMLSQTRLSDVLDPEIANLNEFFLVSSIRRKKLTSWRIRPLDTAQDQRLVSISGPAICESCLSGEDVDILWDALGGFDAFFDLRMETAPPKSFDVASPQGFTPVHCACLGGHLSTLQLLLDMGYSGIQSTIHGITPLHLCIFFAECDMEAAVHLLLECGPCPRETTSEIYWPDYDLTLSGSPLSWAIITRNLKLVKILLPEYSEDRPTDIRNALKNYYWEILDEILRTSPSDEDLWDIYVFVFAQLPYRHWIAHGSDRFSSIDRTLEVIQRHNLIPIEESRYLTSNLMVMMERTSTEEHFHHIERLLELMTSSQIKETDEFHNTVLAVAIIRAKKNTVWVQTFKGILAHYSVEELQTTHFHSAEHGIVDASFLHSAVLRDCVVGARALLEKGVDPNQHSGGRVALTPIHLCVTVKCSVEMWDTLLEFGANMNVETLQSLSSPVTLLTAGGHFENSRLIDHIMKTDHHGEVILNMLLQLILLEPTPESRRYALLRHLLVIPNVAKHLNASTSEGFTLLQLSVLYGLLEITQLLLEAGADPLTGFRFANKNVYPLQVACAMGRFYGDKFTPRNRPLSDLERSKQEKWTRIALLLLEWQVAKNNDPFQGITQLHIASYISIEKEIQRFLAEGIDPKASGKWPHLPEGITPHRLIRTQTAYTKRNEIDNEKNIYKKVWRDQWSMFDRNMTSKSTINTYDLIIHELSAARFLLHCVRKWCKHWSKQDLLSTPDGFD